MRKLTSPLPVLGNWEAFIAAIAAIDPATAPSPTTEVGPDEEVIGILSPGLQKLWAFIQPRKEKLEDLVNAIGRQNEAYLRGQRGEGTRRMSEKVLVARVNSLLEANHSVLHEFQIADCALANQLRLCVPRSSSPDSIEIRREWKVVRRQRPSEEGVLRRLNNLLETGAMQLPQVPAGKSDGIIIRHDVQQKLLLKRDGYACYSFL